MKSDRGKRAVRAILFLLSLAALSALVVFVLRPPCLILERTGWYCPGCGTQRMIFSLFQGDIPGAFAENPFMFFALPAAGVYCMAEALRYVQQKRPLYQSRRFLTIILVIFALAIVFMVLRNLPGFAFLGPR